MDAVSVNLTMIFKNSFPEPVRFVAVFAQGSGRVFHPEDIHNLMRAMVCHPNACSPFILQVHDKISTLSSLEGKR